MPNWCTNHLIIEGPKEDLQDIADHHFMIEQYFPTPVFKRDVFKNNKHDAESLEKIMKKMDQNETDDWYHWRVREWGVKWDCSLLCCFENNYEFDEEDNNGMSSINYYFQSPWEPPVEAYRKISFLYPLCSFTLFFIEESMCFVGYIKYDCSKISYKKNFVYDNSKDLKKIYDENKEFERFFCIETTIEFLKDSEDSDDDEDCVNN